MDNEFAIIEKEIGYIAEIKYHIPIMKMRSCFKAAYQKIYPFVQENNIATNIAPLARYFDIDWAAEVKKSKWQMLLEIFTKKYHINIGIPINKQMEDQDDIKIHFIKKATYISGLHYGSYHNIGQTYTKLYLWAQQNSYEGQSQSIEIYLNDPRQTDQKDLKTQVLIPVK